jgi:hypothetical protein
MGMSSNANLVADQLRQEIDKRRAFVALAVKKAIVDTHASIIERSPVDTGCFRGNNSLVVGEAIPPAIPLTKNEKDAQSRAKRSGAGAEALPRMVSEAQNRMKEAQTAILGLPNKFDQTPTTMMIVNPLPYAEALEEGHSEQAPNGLYALAADALVSQIAAIKNEVGT